MSFVDVTAGDSAVILGQPHCGTGVPDEVFARFNDRGRRLADTDWHIQRLYADLLPGVTTVTARFHRYVLDANRDPADESLYPGQNTTSLCPTIDFDGQPIYRDGQAPDSDEISERRSVYHRAYHDALRGEIERVKSRHGHALLYDCHSVRSEVPYLFDGALPVFNIGTFEGRACGPHIERAATRACGDAESGDGYDWVLNGRFKGGWTTRHYGQPVSGVHAIQMELAQRSYMHESSPWTYDEALARRLRSHLATILKALQQALTSDIERTSA